MTCGCLLTSGFGVVVVVVKELRKILEIFRYTI
jgi:hypothetical protein